MDDRNEPWRCQRCHRCGINSRIWTSAGQLNGRDIFVRYDWLCTTCRNLPSITQNDQSWTAELPFQDQLISSQSSSDTSSSSTLICDTEEPEYTTFLKSCKGTIFCHFNANSIRPRFDELCYLLSFLTISLFAITESKLDSDRDSSSQFQIKGYNSIRQDRNCNSKKSGGGIFSWNSTDVVCPPPTVDLSLPWRRTFVHWQWIPRIHRNQRNNPLFSVDPPSAEYGGSVEIQFVLYHLTGTKYI
jgi:hypothetical protein